jgi:hypothetical protein
MSTYKQQVQAVTPVKSHSATESLHQSPYLREKYRLKLRDKKGATAYLIAILISIFLVSQHTQIGQAQAVCDLCLTFSELGQSASPVVGTVIDMTITPAVNLGTRYDSGAAAAGIIVIWATPSGVRINVPAFYVAGTPPTWHARFMPDRAGLWRAQAWERRAGRLVRAGPQRSVRVLAASGPSGYVRVSRANSAMLELGDGSPYFPIGPNLAWYTNDARAEYERRFAALAHNGGNAARIWLAPWSFAVEWRETPLGDYDNRQDRLAAFDAVLALAEKHGIKLIVVLLEPGMFNVNERWADNPYNSANGGPCASPREFLTDARARAAYSNQLRYIAARWGASPSILAWEWFNEVNSAIGFETDVLMPWLREMSLTLRTADLNRHPHTLSYATIAGDPHIWAMPEIDIVQRHEYAQGDPKWFAPIIGADGRAQRFKQVREQPLKPVLLGEFGANNAGERPEGAYREGIHLHNSLWASTFSGFAGSAMYWWWDNYLEAGDLWPRYRGLAAFVKGEDLRAFEPVTVTATAAGLGRVNALGLARAGARGGWTHALLWVHNKAWSHDNALIRYILDRSSGAASPQSFVFTPRSAEQVTLTLPAAYARNCNARQFDTETGLELDPIPQLLAHPGAANAQIMLNLGDLARDTALKLRCR